MRSNDGRAARNQASRRRSLPSAKARSPFCASPVRINAMRSTTKPLPGPNILYGVARRDQIRRCCWARRAFLRRPRSVRVERTRRHARRLPIPHRGIVCSNKSNSARCRWSRCCMARWSAAALSLRPQRMSAVAEQFGLLRAAGRQPRHLCRRRRLGAAAAADRRRPHDGYDARPAAPMAPRKARPWACRHYLVEPGKGLPRASSLRNASPANSPLTNFAVMHALPRIADMDPASGYPMESLMAAIAQATRTQSTAEGFSGKARAQGDAELTAMPGAGGEPMARETQGQSPRASGHGLALLSRIVDSTRAVSSCPLGAARRPIRTHLTERSNIGRRLRRTAFSSRNATTGRLAQGHLCAALATGRKHWRGPAAARLVARAADRRSCPATTSSTRCSALGAMYVGIPYAPISPAYSLMSSDFGKLRAILDLLTPGPGVRR